MISPPRQRTTGCGCAQSKHRLAQLNKGPTPSSLYRIGQQGYDCAIEAIGWKHLHIYIFTADGGGHRGQRQRTTWAQTVHVQTLAQRWLIISKSVSAYNRPQGVESAFLIPSTVLWLRNPFMFSKILLNSHTISVSTSMGVLNDGLTTVV